MEIRAAELVVERVDQRYTIGLCNCRAGNAVDETDVNRLARCCLTLPIVGTDAERVVCAPADGTLTQANPFGSLRRNLRNTSNAFTV